MPKKKLRFKYYADRDVYGYSITFKSGKYREIKNKHLATKAQNNPEFIIQERGRG